MATAEAGEGSQAQGLALFAQVAIGIAELVLGRDGENGGVVAARGGQLRTLEQLELFDGGIFLGGRLYGGSFASHGGGPRGFRLRGQGRREFRHPRLRRNLRVPREMR